jgi:transcriptional regulator with XRE-family HTH domain
MATKKGKPLATLGDLRLLRGVTQVSLSEKLNVSQSEISRVEKRGNCRLNTLRKYVEDGLGGKLTIFVQFPEDDAAMEIL